MSHELEPGEIVRDLPPGGIPGHMAGSLWPMMSGPGQPMVHMPPGMMASGAMPSRYGHPPPPQGMFGAGLPRPPHLLPGAMSTNVMAMQHAVFMAQQEQQQQQHQMRIQQLMQKTPHPEHSQKQQQHLHQPWQQAAPSDHRSQQQPPGAAQQPSPHIQATSTQLPPQQTQQCVPQPPPPPQAPPQQQPETDASNSPPKEIDENAVDVASAKGIFGWTTIDKVNFPYLLREKKKYLSVRMVEQKLLSKYPSVYPEELKQRPPLMSHYVTQHEAGLLNEINIEHCNHEYGQQRFEGQKDLIVSEKDFEEFYKIVKKHFPEHIIQNLRKNAAPKLTATGGWLQVNNTVIPYVLRTGIKMLPLSVIRYAAGLLVEAKVGEITPTSDECAYLNHSCSKAGLKFNFEESSKLLAEPLLFTYCKEKPSVQELPQDDPFGHAQYQDSPASEATKPVQFGAPLPNMPYVSTAGAPSHTSARPPDTLAGQNPFWMNPHMGIYPGAPNWQPAMGYRGPLLQGGRAPRPPEPPVKRPAQPNRTSSSQHSPTVSQSIQALHELSKGYQGKPPAAPTSSQVNPRDGTSYSRRLQDVAASTGSNVPTPPPTQSGSDHPQAPPTAPTNRDRDVPQNPFSTLGASEVAAAITRLAAKQAKRAHLSPGSQLSLHQEGMKTPPSSAQQGPPPLIPIHTSHSDNVHSPSTNPQAIQDLSNVQPLVIAPTDDSQLDVPALHHQKSRSATPSHRDLTPTPVHCDVTPAPGHRDVTPTPGHRDVTPTPGHRDVTPTTGHRDVTPTPVLRVVAPTPGCHDVAPTTVHRDMTPTPGHHDVAPTPGHCDVTPTSVLRVVAPTPGCHDVVPTTVHRDPVTPTPAVCTSTQSPPASVRSPATAATCSTSPARTTSSSPRCSSRERPLSRPPPPGSTTKISPVDYHNKTISCLVKGGENYALVEALSRVYFSHCGLEEFTAALEGVLCVDVSELSVKEEQSFIAFYGLPTSKLKCNKIVKLDMFDTFMPQLKYMFADDKPTQGGAGGKAPSSQNKQGSSQSATSPKSRTVKDEASRELRGSSSTPPQPKATKRSVEPDEDCETAAKKPCPEQQSSSATGDSLAKLLPTGASKDMGDNSASSRINNNTAKTSVNSIVICID